MPYHGEYNKGRYRKPRNPSDESAIRRTRRSQKNEKFFRETFQGREVREFKTPLTKTGVAKLIAHLSSFSEARRLNLRPVPKIINGKIAILYGALIFFTGCNFTGRIGREAHLIREELPAITEEQKKEIGFTENFFKELGSELRESKEQGREIPIETQNKIKFLYKQITGEELQAMPRLTHNIVTWIADLFIPNSTGGYQIGSPLTGQHIYIRQPNVSSIFHEMGHSAHINSHWGYLFSEELEEISEIAADAFETASLEYLRKYVEGLEPVKKESLIFNVHPLSYLYAKLNEKNSTWIDYKGLLIDSLLFTFEENKKIFNFLNKPNIVDYESLLEEVKKFNPGKASKDYHEFLIKLIEAKIELKKERLEREAEKIRRE
ncbi:MAG TPA: hypothetical protein VJK05_02960 [archaeon]|nr:hypothetical protein [archaeon]